MISLAVAVECVTAGKAATSRPRLAPAPAGPNGTSRPELWATITTSAAVSVTGSAKAASMHSSEPIRSARLSTLHDATRRR